MTGSASQVSLTLGGSEGGTDNGGALTFASSGSVTTYGRFAPGVVAQTIGGGGGFGAVTAADGIGAAGVSFQLGSSGGVGGSADPTNGSTWTIGAGSITTSGVLSDALVAQAIGAGGGLAGFVSDGGQNPVLTSVVLGDPGASGSGSQVILTNQSALTSSGAGALGLIAQSIGGGGGVAQAYGVSAGGPVTLGGAGSGDGAAVNVTSSGDDHDERRRGARPCRPVDWRRRRPLPGLLVRRLAACGSCRGRPWLWVGRKCQCRH